MNSLVLDKEAARLETLRQYEILDTSQEEAFDDLALLAAQICDTPIALINLIDADRQWFKAKVGFDLAQIPRDIGFCPHCVEKGDVLIIPDTLASEKFATSSVVIAEPYVRFYTGIPLKTPEDLIIGTLCVVDTKPREITQKQVDGLRSLARLIMRQLEVRRNLNELALIQSDYKQAKEALHTSEHILSSFFNSAAMMMGIVEVYDNDIKLIRANVASGNSLKVLPTQLQNRFASEMGISQQYIREWIGYSLEAERRMAPVRFEYTHDDSGNQRIFNATVTAIANYNNDINNHTSARQFAYIIEDITERKRTEQQMRSGAALLDVTSDAIILRDLSNKILLWNKSAEKLYGWQAAEVIDSNASDILSCIKSPQYKEIYHTVLEKGCWQGELIRITKSGQEIIVDSCWTLVLDEHSQPKSILTVDTDITQKKQLEAQFLRTQRVESIGTLASGIAHDLNNVLSPILMSAQLLNHKSDNPRESQILSIIEKNAKRGADLVKQVLSFARGMEGEHTNIQLDSLIQEIQQIVEQTFPKSIEFYTDIKPNLQVISGDNTQLHQVLINLCLNARDAMPEGGKLTLTAENILIDENFQSMHIDAKVGQYVLLTLTDTGIGIDRKNLDRIFEPFFTTKEFGQSTGLGLSTVMGIIKGHRGFVNVSSTVGKGTQFKVYLPAVNSQITLHNFSTEIPRGNGELILVVDDEPAIREITKASLESYNYEVITANDGIEAVALFAQHKNQIKAAIIDIMMPNMDGSTTISTLLRMNSLIPIVAVSGLATSDSINIDKDKQSQIFTFLSKPYTAQDLFGAVYKVLK